MSILGKDFPASENQILKVSKRYKLLNKRRIVVCPFAQTNGPILRDGTHGARAQPFLISSTPAISVVLPPYRGEVLPTSPWQALSSPALVPWITSSRCMAGTINRAVYQEVLYLCLPWDNGSGPLLLSLGHPEDSASQKKSLSTGRRGTCIPPL